jgi:hypothetical protein
MKYLKRFNESESKDYDFYISIYDPLDKFVVGAGNSYAVGATSNTQGTGSNLPAYYALCYIMKS